MLPRTFRLSVHDDIEGLVRKGARIYTPFFVIRYRPNTLKKTRCAIIASGTVAPKAVQRNKIRRLFYRTIYDAIKKKSMPTLDLAILPTKKAIVTETPILVEALQKSLSFLPKT